MLRVKLRGALDHAVGKKECCMSRASAMCGTETESKSLDFLKVFPKSQVCGSIKYERLIKKPSPSASRTRASVTYGTSAPWPRLCLNDIKTMQNTLGHSAAVTRNVYTCVAGQIAVFDLLDNSFELPKGQCLSMQASQKLRRDKQKEICCCQQRVRHFETARSTLLYPLFFSLYASPQLHIASRIGLRLYPNSVRVYSTLGGTSG